MSSTFRVEFPTIKIEDESLARTLECWDYFPEHVKLMVEREVLQRRLAELNIMLALEVTR